MPTRGTVASQAVQAWVLRESPGSYQRDEVDTPQPGDDEVQVRVVASALNHMDLWLTRGLPRPALPHVPGCDGAGIVDAVGEGVEAVSVGDEVVINPAVSCRRCRACLAGESPLCRSFGIVGEHRWGAHAELLVVPAANVSRKPPDRSWEECAAFGLVTLTAWRMLRRARLRAGETVLVVGAGGGVSAAAIALARHAGAHVVATTRDVAGKGDAIASLGAHDVVDSADERWPRADVVVESVGPATWEQSVRALAAGGRLVVCGGTSGPEVELNLPRLFFKQHEIIGSTMGSYEEWEQVIELVGAGLPVAVDTVLDLDEYPAALKHLEAGDQLGKVVLRH